MLGPMHTQRWHLAEPIRPAGQWAVVAAATVVSMGALDVVATAAGALLAASHMFHGASQAAVFGFLAATYVLWFAGLRVNVIANWRLLEQTGMSTSLLSKSMFELARRRSSSRRAQRAASAAGYVAIELAKEAPYYAGAFGIALLSDTVGSTDALVFLAGTNVGAAVYEYGVASLSRSFLNRRLRSTPVASSRGSSGGVSPDLGVLGNQRT
jgi:hypothetical protein